MKTTPISNAIQVLMLTVAIHAAVGMLAAQDRESLGVKSDAEVAQGTNESKDKDFTTWGSVQRTVQYDYRLMNPTSKPATEIDVYVPLPRKSPRQEIHYLHLPEPGDHERIFTDKHGQRLAHYKLDRLEAGQYVDLGYVVGITLKNIRWNASEPSPSREAPVLTTEQRELYLRPETNYSMDSEVMRNTAASLVQGAASDYEKLTRIHDYVISSIRYVRDNTWDPAETVLARGTGSCSEYNYVLSGLCRLAGLPTRCVGGTTNGHRNLPTTDTVFHRWTEVFLTEFGWFPADCSRDANPIRGKRSHFGRVYVDAMVWCQQAGGEEDTLGWDYRAKAHVRGDDPGIREDHRTRWFVFHPEEEVESACRWFIENGQTVPQPDLLECALLHWSDASAENRLQMVHALADSGRNACLRRAAMLPETDQVRENCVRELCQTSELADTLLKESRDLYGFRNWFRSHETDLVSAEEGKFKLNQSRAKQKIRTTTASSSEIWTDLVTEVVGRWGESLDSTQRKTVAIMPVIDQTLAELGSRSAVILSALKEQVAEKPGIALVEEEQFGRWMAEQGPGSGEYWILTNGEVGDVSGKPVPDIVVIPVCITSRVKESVLYHLELKVLDSHRCEYTSEISQVYRKAEDERLTDQAVLVHKYPSSLVGLFNHHLDRRARQPCIAAVEQADSRPVVACFEHLNLGAAGERLGEPR